MQQQQGYSLFETVIALSIALLVVRAATELTVQQSIFTYKINVGIQNIEKKLMLWQLLKQELSCTEATENKTTSIEQNKIILTCNGKYNKELFIHEHRLYVKYLSKNAKKIVTGIYNWKARWFTDNVNSSQKKKNIIIITADICNNNHTICSNCNMKFKT